MSLPYAIEVWSTEPHLDSFADHLYDHLRRAGLAEVVRLTYHTLEPEFPHHDGEAHLLVKGYDGHILFPTFSQLSFNLRSCSPAQADGYFSLAIEAIAKDRERTGRPIAAAPSTR